MLNRIDRDDECFVRSFVLLSSRKRLSPLVIVRFVLIKMISGRQTSEPSRAEPSELHIQHSDDADFRIIGNETPFKISNRSSRFVPLILPSRTKFPNYKDYQISPQSSGLVYTVAVIPLVLSIRQIYQQHNNSIEDNGLSSPFLVVVPYMVMTFVNLMANMSVGSYTQIIVLPMEKETLPEDRNDNQVFIGSWGTKGNSEAAQGEPRDFGNS